MKTIRVGVFGTLTLCCVSLVAAQPKTATPPNADSTNAPGSTGRVVVSTLDDASDDGQGSPDASANGSQDDTSGRTRIRETAVAAPRVNSIPGGGGVGYAMTDPFGMRGYVDRGIGGGIGWDNGYTNIGLFVPFHIDPDYSLFFFDGRALLPDVGNGGGVNLTAGYRAYNEELDRIYSFAGFWDHDPGHAASKAYQQTGFVFESLGQWVDARFAGYLPVGTDSYRLSDTTIGSPFFTGNNIAVTRQTISESAFRGLEAELGGPLPLLGRFGFRGYFGGYYRHSDSDLSAGGVMGRAVANITDDWQMSVSVSNDRTFGTNVWMNVVFALPDGRPERWFRLQDRVQDRLKYSPQRQYRVQTHRHIAESTVNTVDPDDLADYLVAHIDPLAGGSNSGTVANPFLTLADYNALPEATRRAFDFIFVHDGTVSGTLGNTTALDDGITLYDNQRLLSSAPLSAGLPSGLPVAATTPVPNFHQFTYTVAFDPSILKTTDFPGVETSASRPILSNVTGGEDNNGNGVLDVGEDDNGNGTLDLSSVVTIAGDNVEVSGFIIDGQTGLYDAYNGNGIVTDTVAAGSRAGFTIMYNRFVNNVNAAVLTNNGDGVGVFRYNDMVGMGNNGTTNSNIGLSLTNTNSAFLQLSVRDNIAQSFRGEDLDNDGVLDGGEDLNGNGTLDLGYGFNIVAEDSSTITGNASGDPVTGFLFNNNTSTANGSGLAYSANTGGTVNISVTGNILSGNVGASTGVSVMADAGTVNMFSLANNAIQNNVGNGVELYAMNGGTITSLLSEDLNNDSTINEAETDDNLNGVADPDEDVNSNGLLDPSEDTNGNAVLDLGITGNVITGNGGNGFIAVADNGSITGLHIGSADLNLPRATTVGALTTPDNIITDNGTATTIGGGIVIQTAAGGGTITGSIVNNLLDNSRDGSLSDNEGDNIFVSAAGGGTITLDSISNNSATGAGSAGGTSSAGLHFALADSSQITITDGIRYNSFNDNTGASFFATIDSGKLDVGTVTTNNFNRTVAGTHGALINATNNGQFAGTFIRNTFNGDVTANANTGVGFLLRADGGIAGETDIDVAIGSVNTSDANSFVGNTDVGIGFELTGSRTDPLLAEVSIRNNTIQSTTDGGLAGYAGEAIVLNVDGSGGAVVPLGGPQVNSVLQDSVIANNLIGHATDTTLANVSTGLSINVSGYGSIQDLLVDSNGIFDSGTNGIDFNRSGSASLEAVTQTHAIVFSNNTVDRSTLNAVNITTDGTKFYTDSTTINDQDMLFDTNTLSNSGAFGVQMVYGGDSRLVVDLTDNLIERNASGGIDATHQFVIFPPPFVADDPDMFGTYLGNVIRLNGTDINDAGIAIRGSATVSIGDGTEAGRNIIGGLAADGLTRNGNTGDGIFVDLGDNNVTINTNTITYNGGDGIDLESNGVATITNNNISHNGLDGIEILTPGTSTLFQSWDVTINQNTIARNQGRGVDLLNRSNATTSLRVDDNTIVNNGQEGVYIVNTSSETQTQDGLGTDALASDGAINRVPTVFARISGNTITGNGTVAQADSIGGLVLRGGSSTSADTYLSTNGQIAPPLATQLDLTTGDEFSALGKIEAEIENNLFGGNWGYDFYVDTFTSTVDPATTAGTWNTTTFTLTQLQRDPLARIDIVRFRGNFGDSMLVTGPLNGGAFYNNAEGTFKSRTNNLTPAGPFPQAGGATRRRNATRIAGDGSPFVGPGSNFQYDGFGSQSTLRVESGAQDAGFFGSGRFSDSVGFTNTVFGEFSYIWDQTLAPDTVFP